VLFLDLSKVEAILEKINKGKEEVWMKHDQPLKFEKEKKSIGSEVRPLTKS
jgi:hypothetical protein